MVASSPSLAGNSDGIGNYVLTDANGEFALSAGSGGSAVYDYTCTTPSTQVYIYAVGGNSGGGSNSAAGFLAALGPCGNLSFSTSISVNEATTVASAYALSAFATDALHVSSSATPLAETDLANAFANATNLVDPTSGDTLATTPAGNGTVPQATINTLANILASCVNSSDATSGNPPVTSNSSACQTLFSAALSAGASGIAPTDTATAAVYIAHNPAANTAALFPLTGSTPPFAPALSTQPADFTLSLAFTGGGLSAATQVAVDGQGNVWAIGSSTDIAELNSLGAPISPSTGYTPASIDQPTLLLLSPSGYPWIGSGDQSGSTPFLELSTSGAQLNTIPSTYLPYPGGTAFDASGNLWSLPPAGSSAIVEYDGSGNYLQTVSLPIIFPGPLTIDPTGNLWIYDYNNGELLEYSGAGTPSTSNPISNGQFAASNALAFDAAGNLWGIDSQDVFAISSSGTPLAGSAISASLGSSMVNSSSLQLDGSGTGWALMNLSSFGGPPAPSILQPVFNTGGSLSLGPAYTLPTSASSPNSLALDGSGDAWITNNTAAITEYIGLTAPVVTPTSASLVSPYVPGSRP
jgi:hypothetical protein